MMRASTILAAGLVAGLVSFAVGTRSAHSGNWLGIGGDRGHETGYSDQHVQEFHLDKWSPGINATVWCVVGYRSGEIRQGGCFLYDRRTHTWVK